jgi:hypothetical protein
MRAASGSGHIASIVAGLPVREEVLSAFLSFRPNARSSYAAPGMTRLVNVRSG